MTSSILLPDPAAWFKPGRLSAADVKKNITDPINGLLSGGATDPATVDPPSVVTATATAYPAAGGSSASIADVDVLWVAPTNSDGTPETTIAAYQLSYALVHPAPGTLANPAPSSPLWSGAVTVDALETTIVKLRSGDQFSARVRTLDGTGKHSGWTYSAPIVLSLYVATMPTPSTPVVDSYLGVLRARWDGLDSTGASMTANSAFDHIDVHWSTSSSFTPSASTRTGTLNAAGSSFLTTANYGTTYYCRFIAVSRVGDTSPATSAVGGAASQVVSADLFAGCVGTAQLAYAAVKTANIDNLAVNDAQIGSVAVGKLTAGYLSAQVLLSNQIATATSGARCVFDATGIHLYNSGGALTVDLNTNGSASFTGSITGSAITGGVFQTATSYPYIKLGASGTDPQTLMFVDSNNRTASISSRPITSGVSVLGLNAPSADYTSASGTYIVLSSTGGIQLNANNTSAGVSTNGALGVNGAVSASSLTINSTSASISTSGYLSCYQVVVNSGAVTLGNGGTVTATSNINSGGFFQTTRTDNTSGGVRNYMNLSGDIGIGSTKQGGSNSNAYQLQFYVGSASTPAAVMGTGGNISTSTMKVKKHVKAYLPSRALVDDIRPVTYRVKKSVFPGADDERHFGVIAEHLADSDSGRQFVGFDAAGEPMGVAYDRLALAAALSVNDKVAELELRLTKAGM